MLNPNTFSKSKFLKQRFIAVCLQTLSQMQQFSELAVDCDKKTKILLLQTIIQSLLLPGKSKHE